MAKIMTPPKAIDFLPNILPQCVGLSISRSSRRQCQAVRLIGPRRPFDDATEQPLIDKFWATLKIKP
ncbi:hypothetical protein EN802_10100 [bacterium M00.F.Ca.ET.159.01.1.1]|nr:hypothetical protein EN802_10100 [bacterium M00.F.Ca.ET.159.01.1.1]TGT88206.1 hypothetical protein EN800_06990 [bacterium M00.F.Ca.ET.157.01.1.1]